MSIRFRCHKCKATISAPDSAGGKRGRCPDCGEVQSIPERKPATSRCPWEFTSGAACAVEAGQRGLVRPGASGAAKARWIGQGKPPSSVTFDATLTCPSCGNHVDHSFEAFTTDGGTGGRGSCANCRCMMDLMYSSYEDSNETVIFVVATVFARPGSGGGGAPGITLRLPVNAETKKAVTNKKPRISQIPDIFDCRDRDKIKAFVDAGGDINARDFRQQTALHSAAFWDDVELVETLLAFGADPNLPATPGSATRTVDVVRNNNKPNARQIVELLTGARPPRVHGSRSAVGSAKELGSWAIAVGVVGTLLVVIFIAVMKSKKEEVTGPALFFSAMVSPDPDKLAALCSDSLGAQLDRDLVRAWAKANREALGDFKNIAGDPARAGSDDSYRQEFKAIFENRSLNVMLWVEDGKIASFKIHEAQGLPSLNAAVKRIYAKKCEAFLRNVCTGDMSAAASMLPPAGGDLAFDRVPIPVGPPPLDSEDGDTPGTGPPRTHRDTGSLSAEMAHLRQVSAGRTLSVVHLSDRSRCDGPIECGLGGHMELSFRISGASRLVEEPTPRTMDVCIKLQIDVLRATIRSLAFRETVPVVAPEISGRIFPRDPPVGFRGDKPRRTVSSDNKNVYIRQEYTRRTEGLRVTITVGRDPEFCESVEEGGGLKPTKQFPLYRSVRYGKWSGWMHGKKRVVMRSILLRHPYFVRLVGEGTAVDEDEIVKFIELLNLDLVAGS